MLLQRMFLWRDIMCVCVVLAVCVCVLGSSYCVKTFFADVDVVDAVCRSAHH
jgi:hypothetical protein